MAVLNREDWITQAGEAILDDIVMPAFAACKLDFERPKVAYMRSFPPAVRNPETVAGFCMARKCSDAGKNEISVSPFVADSETALATLAHELIHAVLDNQDGHKGRFLKVARYIGFESPVDELHASQALTDTLQPYHDYLGDIPADKLTLADTRVKKKQTNRQLKCECTECGFTFRASKTQLTRLHAESVCPVCDLRGTLEIEQKD